MSDQPATAAQPAPGEVAEALQRANAISWMSWLAVTLVAAGLFVRGRWGDGLISGACVQVVFIQHYAIKVARLMGHGKR